MEQERKWWHWAILIVLSLIWGSSFILMKRGLETFSSLQVGAIRIFISSLILLPLALKHLRRIDRNTLGSLLIIGLIGNAFPAVLFPTAQLRLESAATGMLNSLTPLFTLLTGIVLYQRKAHNHQVMGILLGLVGAAGLLYEGGINFNSYGLLVVLATFFYGISANQVTRIHNMNGAVITALAFMLIGPPAAVFLFSTQTFALLTGTEAWINFMYIALLAVFGSGLALVLFNILILNTSPMFGVTVTYIAPVVAAFWGALDGEAITSVMFLSVGCILLGVYQVTRRIRKPQNKTLQAS